MQCQPSIDWYICDRLRERQQLTLHQTPFISLNSKNSKCSLLLQSFQLKLLYLPSLPLSHLHHPSIIFSCNNFSKIISHSNCSWTFFFNNNHHNLVYIISKTTPTLPQLYQMHSHPLNQIPPSRLFHTSYHLKIFSSSTLFQQTLRRSWGGWRFSQEMWRGLCDLSTKIGQGKVAFRS